MFQDFIRVQIPQMENTYLNTSRYELLKAIYKINNKHTQSYFIWAHKTRLTGPSLLKCLIKSEQWVIMYLCVRGIEFSSFYDFSIGF